METSFEAPPEWMTGTIVGFDVQSFPGDTLQVMVGMPLRIFNILPLTYQYFTIGFLVRDANGDH